MQGLAAFNRYPVGDAIHANTKRREGQFRMITCGDALVNCCAAVGMESGQEHRALDLRAWHVRREFQGRQGAARDRHRQAPVVGLEAGAHLRQGRDHTLHRPPAQRLVSGHCRRERVPGKNSGQQASGGSGIARVEGLVRGDETAQTASRDHNRPRRRRVGGPGMFLDAHAQLSQARQCRAAVGTGRVVGEPGSSGRQRAAQRVAVRDRLVARDADAARQPGSRRYPRLEGRGHQGTIARGPGRLPAGPLRVGPARRADLTPCGGCVIHLPHAPQPARTVASE